MNLFNLKMVCGLGALVGIEEKQALKLGQFGLDVTPENWVWSDAFYKATCWCPDEKITPW